jgi:hypothetical protein
MLGRRRGGVPAQACQVVGHLPHIQPDAAVKLNGGVQSGRHLVPGCARTLVRRRDQSREITRSGLEEEDFNITRTGHLRFV